MNIYILEVNLSKQTVSTFEAFLISVTVTELMSNTSTSKYSGQAISSSDESITLIE
jgi:hypothetical protein